MVILKKKIQGSKRFDEYITPDISLFESQTNSKCVNNIISIEDKRKLCGASLKRYIESKQEKDGDFFLPSLDKVNYYDYLPARV
jgi:hypothetical protein